MIEDPTLREYLGIAAAVLGIAAHIPYVANVLRHKTKPHTFSWFLWALLGGIGFFGQQSDNAGPGAWGTAVMCVVCGIIFLLSLFKGEKTITRFDYWSLGIALASIPLWLMTKTALWAMVLISLIDFLAYFPTIRKSYMKPFEETALTFLANSVKWTLSLLALDTWSMITALYPASLWLTNTVFGFMLLIRRAQLQQTEATTNLP